VFDVKVRTAIVGHPG